MSQKGIERAGSDPTWSWKFRLVKADSYNNLRKMDDAGRTLSEAGEPPAEFRGKYLVLGADRLRRQGSLADARALLAEARKLTLAGNSGDLALEVKQHEFYVAPTRDEAVRILHEVLADATNVGNKRIESLVLIDLGFLRTKDSRFDEALHYLVRAERITSEAKYHRLRGLAMGNIGWCQLMLGDSDQAIETLRTAERLSRDSGDIARAAIWINNIGNWHYRRAEYAASRDKFQESATLSEQAGDSENLTRAIANFTEASIQIEDVSAAESALRRVQAMIRPLPREDKSVTFGQYLEGRVAIQRGEWKAAEAAFQQVVRRADELNFPGVLWSAHRELAQVYARTERPADADREYRTALDIVDREWKTLNDDVLRVGFLSSLIELYQGYVEFLVAQGSDERALEVAESSRARVLARRLDQQLSVTSQVLPSPARLKTLASSSNTVFLSFWTAPKRSFVWVIGRDGISRFDLPPRDQIANLAARYNAAVTAGHDPIERGNPYGAELFAMLLGQAAAKIPKGSSVIAAVDGGLHRLNLETLVVPEPKPHYWIEDVAVAVAPSLAGLDIAAASPQIGRDANLLFIGDPVPPDPMYPALMYLGRERQVVESHFQASRRSVFTRADAQPAIYRQAEPSRFSHLHFAAHAVPNDDKPLLSSVILSSNQSGYRLYAQDVLHQPLRASLVVLSACHGAGTKSFSGEGLLGFSWAFLSSGARNVVAGLWQVDDEATVDLMRRLYDGMATGLSPSVSLHRAKLALLKAGPARSPYYWGSFQLFTRDAVRGGVRQRPRQTLATVIEPVQAGSARP